MTTPSNPSDAFDLAVQQMAEGKLAEARATFEAVTTSGTLVPQAWNNLGMIEMQEGHFEAAEAALRKALEADERFYQPHLNLGAVALQREDTAAAEAHFLKAMQYGSDVPEVYHNLGVLYYQTKQLPKAKSMFEKYCQLRDDDAKAYLQLGVIYFQMQEFYPALANLLTAVGIEPELQEARRALAETYLRQGRPLQAARALGSYIMARPDDVHAMLRLALLHIDMKQQDVGEELLDRVLAQDASLIEAREVLALLYYDQGRVEEAKGAFQQILLVAPDNELAAQFLAEHAAAAPEGAAP